MTNSPPLQPFSPNPNHTTLTVDSVTGRNGRHELFKHGIVTATSGSVQLSLGVLMKKGAQVTGENGASLPMMMQRR